MTSEVVSRVFGGSDYSICAQDNLLPSMEFADAWEKEGISPGRC